MAESFQPYREWLGLPDDVSQPTYYQLLGLAEFESDPQKIALGGDRATTKVRSFRPGKHAKAWSDLIDEIFAAKTCLLDPEIKAAYDRRLMAGSQAPRRPERRAGEGGAAKKPVGDADYYPPGMAPPGAKKTALSQPTPAAPVAYPAWQQPGYGVPTAVPLASYPAGQHPAGQAMAPYAPAAVGMPLDPMAPVAIPAAAPQAFGPAAPVFQSSLQQLAASAAMPAPSQPQMSESAQPVSIKSASQPAPSQRGLLIAGVGGGVLLLAAGIAYLAFVSNRQPAPDDVAVAPQAIPTAVPDNPPVVAPVPVPSPMPAPMADPTPAPAPDPMPEPPPPTPTPTPLPTPTPAPSPSPIPAPEPPPMATRQELIALGKALTKGKLALGEQNFAAADEHIATAVSLAKSPEHQALAARLQEVGELVKQFRAAVEAAAQGFEAGEVFKVGTSTQVAVVETLPDRLKLRIAGSTRDFPFGVLPAGLAVAIADFQLDAGDPQSRIIKGAYLAVEKKKDPEAMKKAKSFWEEAQLSGSDTSHLLPFLTDDYDLDKPAAKASTTEVSTRE
ncbi:MAG: hypothetical protein WD872_16860 [Pirellulaceae bacterium]